METTCCPECGHLAELVDRTVLESTDGPIEHVHVRCVQRHRFWLPAEYLARTPHRAPRAPARRSEPAASRRR